MRHKMLSVTYNWNNEKAIVRYSKEFESYNYVQKLDSLKDVMWELQQRYEEEIELGRIYWEERRKLREETA
jgi:uncharacterized protein YcgL (UPF0745 family)